MKAKFVSLIIGLGMLALFLTACSGQEETTLPNLPYGTVTARAGINVRSGPGEDYAAIGTLAFREDTAIVGRSVDSAWWVIPMQGAADNQGWISAEFVDAYNTENVPVIPPPASGSTDTGSTGSGSTASGSDITGIVWKWQTYEDVAAGASTRVDDPNKYTIVFNADGTTTGRADCNTFSGTYSQDGGFTISVTPDVMAACDQGSMDQQFLNLLDDVAAGGPDGAGGLVLQTAGGAQKMMFSNGGSAE
ncbi:MAG: META domain-containing protein [Chloroflexota bacterium]